VVLGAVAPTAVIVAGAGAALIVFKLDEAALERLDSAAQVVCRPISDKRGTHRIPHPHRRGAGAAAP